MAITVEYSNSSGGGPRLTVEFRNRFDAGLWRRMSNSSNPAVYNFSIDINNIPYYDPNAETAYGTAARLIFVANVPTLESA